MTVIRHPVGIHFQGLEENILFGKHNAQEVLQALPVVIGSVHMDMDAAGIVYFSPGLSHLPDALLEFRKFRIGQFG